MNTIPYRKRTIEEKRKYQNEIKKKQQKSIIVRSYVLMRILSNNYGYSFLINNKSRKAKCGFHNYQISQIYNSNGILLFDIESKEIKIKVKKLIYCQIYLIEIMIKELESLGYQFKKYQTKKSRKEKGNMNPITLTKVFEFSWYDFTSLKYCFNMNILEETLGMETYKWINEIFENCHYRKIGIGNYSFFMNLFSSLHNNNSNKQISLNEIYVENNIYSFPIEFYYCQPVII